MHTHNVYIKLVRTLYKRHLFLSRLWLLSKILRNFKSWAELRKFKVQTSVFRTWWKDDSVRITLRKLKKTYIMVFAKDYLLLKIIVFYVHKSSAMLTPTDKHNRYAFKAYLFSTFSNQKASSNTYPCFYLKIILFEMWLLYNMSLYIIQ